MTMISRRNLLSLTLSVFVLFTVISASSCSKKTGCPTQDKHTKLDKYGMPKAKKPSSGLLPEKGRKK